MQNIRIDESEGEASEYSRDVEAEGEAESEEGSSMEEDETMENLQVYE